MYEKAEENKNKKHKRKINIPQTARVVRGSHETSKELGSCPRRKSRWTPWSPVVSPKNTQSTKK